MQHVDSHSLNAALAGNPNGNTLLHRAVAVLDDYKVFCFLRKFISKLNSLKKLALVLPSLNMRGSVEQRPNAQKHLPLHLAVLLGKTSTATGWKRKNDTGTRKKLTCVQNAALQLCMPASLPVEPDAHGNTLLHLAVTGRAVDWTAIYTAPQLEARNALFFTPLMTCCAVGSRHAVSALLALGCAPITVHETTRRAALAHLELRDLSKIVLSLRRPAVGGTGVIVMGSLAVPETASPASASPLSIRKSRASSSSLATDSPAASPSTGRKTLTIKSLLGSGGSGKIKANYKILGTLKF